MPIRQTLGEYSANKLPAFLYLFLQVKIELPTCFFNPSMEQTMSLEYGCAMTYCNRLFCGSIKS